MNFRLTIAALLCSVMLVGGVRAEGQASAPQATPQQVEQWVAELDHNLFDVRERAQLSLEGAGTAALIAVAEEAQTGSLESSTRALNVLLAWAEGEDHALRIAALERIVKLPQRPTEAQLASEILADAREEAALAKIVELGGLHTIDPQYGGAFIVNQNGRPVGPVQVILGAHWKGGVEGLKHLKEVRRITTLSLHSSPLGDDAIDPLLGLEHLKRIELYGSKISNDGVAKLREKLRPETTLAVRSGARLGIQGSPLTGVAQVQQVIEGSAAEKAGLQMGDVITALDGESIKDFTSLTDRIATHQPGDSVVLKVRRPNANQTDTEEKEITVTFDQWGIDELKPPGFVQPIEAQIQGQILPPNTIRIERR